MTRTAAPRITRLERRARGEAIYQGDHAAFPLTESLESAIHAAERETGLPILDINPLALSSDVGNALATSTLDAMEAARKET